MAMMERLEGGLEKLKSTAAQVDDLKEKLAAQEVISVLVLYCYYYTNST